MDRPDSLKTPSRRTLLRAGLAATALLAPAARRARREAAELRCLARAFSRPRARQGHFGSDLEPRDGARRSPTPACSRSSRASRSSPKQTWQYINRRVSDWRIINGKIALKKNEALFARIEKDFGVERGTLLALWGVESAFGDPLVQQNHMRPIFPSLAALAWNEPRRKPYWESELINALRIVDRGWGTPQEMRGSWAGAMGHTQWMPEVWLNVGIDYDGDGKVSPFGKPDDALGSTAKYLRQSRQVSPRRALGLRGARERRRQSGSRTYAAWASAGVTRADGQPFPQPNASRAALDAGAGRAGIPARDRISIRCGATTRR